MIVIVASAVLAAILVNAAGACPDGTDAVSCKTRAAVRCMDQSPWGGIAQRNPPSCLRRSGGLRLPPSLFELRRTSRLIRPTRSRQRIISPPTGCAIRSCGSLTPIPLQAKRAEDRRALPCPPLAATLIASAEKIFLFSITRNHHYNLRPAPRADTCARREWTRNGPCSSGPFELVCIYGEMQTPR